jgi:hypothetical protein
MPSSTALRRRARDRRHPALRWLTPRRRELDVLLAVTFIFVTILGTVAFTRYQQQALVRWSRCRPGCTCRSSCSSWKVVRSPETFRGSWRWPASPHRWWRRMPSSRPRSWCFASRLIALHLRLARGHVVVAGLGGRGSCWYRNSCADGHEVVVIEADDSSAGLATVRALGGLVVVGDARSPDTLERAGVDRADHLVALCADDSINAEIVATAQHRAEGRRRGHRLHCVAHIREPGLCLLLTGTDVGRTGQA